LRLRVPGAAALEVQHRSGQLVERVNAYFGHKMIDDIRLVQGTIAQRAAARPPLDAPDAKTSADMERRAASVQDPELRAALARLGARIATRRHVLAGGGAGGPRRPPFAGGAGAPARAPRKPLAPPPARARPGQEQTPRPPT